MLLDDLYNQKVKCYKNRGMACWVISHISVIPIPISAKKLEPNFNLQGKSLLIPKLTFNSFGI